jgi:3-oxoacyl-[acyl-carrier-protein] synthase II
MVARECLIGRDDRGQVEAASRLPWPMAKINPSDITWPKHEPWWVNNRKFANITAHWAVSSAYLALRNRTPLAPEEASRSAVIMTSGGGGEDELTVNFPRILASAKKDPRPIATLLYEEIPDYSYIMGIPSQIGQFVSKACGFDGSNVAVFGECGVGGFGALSAGVRMLQSDEFDRVMVVGVGRVLQPHSLLWLDRHGPLGTEASEGRGPFDANRNGTLIGEGAAAIMLENADRVGDAMPLAFLRGCETVCAPTHAAAADAVISMVTDGLERAPGLWWAHGAGSKRLDAEECQAVSPKIRAATTASKGTIGNVLECSALIDLTLVVEALRSAKIPPIGLLQTPDPDLGDIDFVFNEARHHDFDTALVTALGYGDMTSAGAAIVTKGRLQ